MTLPSWDIMLAIVIAAFVGYAFLFLRGRVIGSLLAAYAAYLITITWSNNLYGLLTGSQELFGFSFSFSVTPFSVYTGLFLSLWLLLVAFALGKKHRMPDLEVIAHAIFTIAFVISSVTSFMTDEQRQALTNQSKIASLANQYHQLLLIVPIIFLLYSAIRSGGHSSNSADST